MALPIPMATRLFSEEFRPIDTDEEFGKLCKEFSQYDPAYLCQSTYGLRQRTKNWMEELWTLYEPYTDPHFLEEFKRHFTQRSWEMYLGVISNAGVIAGTNYGCRGSMIYLSNAIPGGIWSSSDTSIATISNSGIITTKVAGVTWITYQVINGACTDAVSKIVTVSDSAQPITGPNTICLDNTIQLHDITTEAPGLVMTFRLLCLPPQGQLLVLALATLIFPMLFQMLAVEHHLFIR